MASKSPDSGPPGPSRAATTRSGVFLAGTRTANALLRFGRNILLARLLAVEDFGTASTFMVAIALVDTVSDLGLERLVVQDEEGDRLRFLAAIHGLTVARGLLLAGLLFVTAAPVARLFGHPELTWAYQLFALIPALRGFMHMDMMREQRQMRFGMQAWSELLGVAGSLLLLWPAFVWLGDFRVVLMLLASDYFLRTIYTQLRAENQFRIGWDRKVFARALRFGWPLLSGGIIGFLIMQGDRVLVANRFTAHDLGIFSAALTFGMTPSLVAGSIAHSFFLPLLSSARGVGKEAFERQAVLTMQAMFCIGASGILLIIYVGPWLFALVFGARYAAGAELAVLLGIAFALRLIRAAPTTVAMAGGRTLNLLQANLVRLAGFLGAVAWVVWGGGGIRDIVLFGIAGELGALAVSILLIHRWGGFNQFRPMAAPYMVSVIFLSVALFISLKPGARGVDFGVHLAGNAVLLILLALTCRPLLAMLVHRSTGQEKGKP